MPQCSFKDAVRVSSIPQVKCSTTSYLMGGWRRLRPEPNFGRCETRRFTCTHLSGCFRSKLCLVLLCPDRLSLLSTTATQRTSSTETWRWAASGMWGHFRLSSPWGTLTKLFHFFQSSWIGSCDPKVCGDTPVSPKEEHGGWFSCPDSNGFLPP